MHDTASTLGRALDWLEGQSTEMEALLRELVEVSSWTHDKPGVDRAMSVLRAATPLAATNIASREYGDHVFFHSTRAASAGGVLLVGHMDTVFPRERFAGYSREGDIARGPGVLDMKGGLVVVTFALRALEQVGALSERALSWAVVSDEEVGSPDSAPALRRLAAGARAALVFEAGRPGDAIITRRKGTGSLTAVAHGRAGHAGNAHREGANAIWALARFVDAAQGLTDYARGVTVNTGTIAGGVGKNTVPDRAEAQLDLRFVTRADAEALRAELTRIAQAPSLANTRIELAWGPGRWPLERSAESAALYSTFAAHQRAAGLGDGEMPLVGGGSDAATTAEVGVASIDGLGPRGAGFHTLDEHIEISSLKLKSEALLRYLLAP